MRLPERSTSETVPHRGFARCARIRPGDAVSFSGPMVDHERSFARRIGVDVSEGAGQLTLQRAHVVVPFEDLEVQ